MAFIASLPVDVLMKSAPAIIATQLARATLRSVIRSPVPRIAFMCAGAAGLLKRRNFVVERLPLAVEDVRARDHDVDLVRARFDAAVNLLHALGERRKARGKPARLRRRGCRCLRRPSPRFDKRVIDADRADRQMQFLNAELHEMRCSGLRALAQSRRTRSAESSPLSVVRSMQAMARSSQAACVSFFTVRRATCVGRGAPPRWCLRGRLHPIEVERYSRVWQKGAITKNRS